MRNLACLAISVLILAFALFGVARAALPAANVSMIEICSDHGAIRIAVDANGQPVGQTPPCICTDCCDCGQVSGLDVPRGTALAVRQITMTKAPALAEGAVLPSRRLFTGQPRGPPQPDIQT